MFTSILTPQSIELNHMRKHVNFSCNAGNVITARLLLGMLLCSAIMPPLPTFVWDAGHRGSSASHDTAVFASGLTCVSSLPCRTPQTMVQRALTCRLTVGEMPRATMAVWWVRGWWVPSKVKRL